VEATVTLGFRTVPNLTLPILAIALLPALACSARPGGQTTAMTLSREADPCDAALTSRDATAFADPEIRALRTRVRSAAGASSYLERLGWAWIERERVVHDHRLFDLALATAACLQERSPGNAEAPRIQAHALVSLHRFKEGEQVARRRVASGGSWIDHAVLGDALIEQGQIEEAAEQYQIMADGNPGPQAWSRAAHLRWLLGDRQGAIEAMGRAARALDGRDPQSAAWCRVRLAHYALEAGRDQEARRLTEAALRLVPDHPAALHVLGLLQLLEGRADDAIGSFRTAAEADPLPEYQWALLEALREAGQDSDAAVVERRLLSEGEREDPRSLALFLASTGRDPARALRLAMQELQTRQDPITLDVVAVALLVSGRVAEAGDYLRRAQATGTRSPRLAIHAALIAAAAGDAREALLQTREAAGMRAALLPSERRRLEALQSELQVPTS
jgi:tetratricopeptide (TPR) repeat protein